MSKKIFCQKKASEILKVLEVELYCLNSCCTLAETSHKLRGSHDNQPCLVAVARCCQTNNRSSNIKTWYGAFLWKYFHRIFAHSATFTPRDLLGTQCEVSTGDVFPWELWVMLRDKDGSVLSDAGEAVSSCSSRAASWVALAWLCGCELTRTRRASLQRMTRPQLCLRSAALQLSPVHLASAELQRLSASPPPVWVWLCSPEAHGAPGAVEPGVFPQP